MASLSGMTDHQLRQELKTYGINAAVTASTRSILLKRLNHLKSASEKPKSNSKAQKEQINNLSLNSETSQLESSRRGNKSLRKSNLGRFYSRRKADSDQRSILNSYSSDDDDVTEPEGEPTEPAITKSKPRRSLRNSPSTSTKFKAPHIAPFSLKSQEPQNITQAQYDTGSDSDIDLLDETDNQSNRSTSGSFLLMDRLSSARSNPSFLLKENKQKKKQIPSSFEFSSRISNSFQSDLTNGNDPRELEITSPDDIITQDSFISQKSPILNGQNNYSRHRMNSKDQVSTDTNIWLCFVPLFLVIMVIMFFILLIYIYLSIHFPILQFSPVLPPIKLSKWIPRIIDDFYKTSDPPSITGVISSKDSPASSDMSNLFPICEKNGPIQMSCLSVSEAEAVQELLVIAEKSILPCLLDYAKVSQCEQNMPLFLQTEAIASHIRDKDLSLRLTKSEIVTGLHGLGKLSKLHPSLGIDSDWNEDNLILLGLAAHNPPWEIMCHIKTTLFHVARYFSMVLMICFSVAVLCWGIIWMYRYRQRIKEDLEQKTFELVEQILELLENSCDPESQNFIAVDHVRDCFIPPRQRQEKLVVWKKAVEFIDNHDSRVYREDRIVGGKETEVWRWVSGAPKSPPEKMWQGQAFEENTINIPEVSPTSCLKIRNMFDSDIEFGENWPRRIQDSLLEKCEGVDVVHVAVDRMSKEGCVYVKCANAMEAGKAYKSLHGWWFDGNLVTVKYLRDERYHERFPSASSAQSPLKPSNNKRLSLQTKLEPEVPLVEVTRKRTALRSVSRTTRS